MQLVRVLELYDKMTRFHTSILLLLVLLKLLDGRLWRRCICGNRRVDFFGLGNFQLVGSGKRRLFGTVCYLNKRR